MSRSSHNTNAASAATSSAPAANSAVAAALSDLSSITSQISAANLQQMTKMRKALFGSDTTAPTAAGNKSAAANSNAPLLSANSLLSSLVSGGKPFISGSASAAVVSAATSGLTSGLTGGASSTSASSSANAAASLDSRLLGVRSAGFPKLNRSRGTKSDKAAAPSSTTTSSAASASSSSAAASAPSGKSLCLPGCTTYPRCTCRLKSSLKAKIKQKFDLRTFLTSTSSLSLASASSAASSSLHLSTASSSARDKESEQLSAIRMLADLLEDGKICIAETVGGGGMERLNACLQIPALQNAALETLGVILQCWLKVDRSVAANVSASALQLQKSGKLPQHSSTCTKNKAAIASSTAAGKKSSITSSKTTPAATSSSSSASSNNVVCPCCVHTNTPNSGLCGTCNVCTKGGHVRFETWVQLQTTPTQTVSTAAKDGEVNDSTTTSDATGTTVVAAPAATTPVLPAPSSSSPNFTISPTSGTGAILLSTALRLLKQPDRRKMACYIISHYSSIPAAALVLTHMEGAIATLIEVYQSLSDTKDSQLLVHLSAILAGLCAKPSSKPMLFPIVPVLLQRFRQCPNTLVLAYICTALGRLCDGQPIIAAQIIEYNIASYLLFIFYSSVERVSKREGGKPRKDEILFEDVYGLLGLLVFHDPQDVSVLLHASKNNKPAVQQPFAWTMKTIASKYVEKLEFDGLPKKAISSSTDSKKSAAELEELDAEFTSDKEIVQQAAAEVSRMLLPNASTDDSVTEGEEVATTTVEATATVVSSAAAPIAASSLSPSSSASGSENSSASTSPVKAKIVDSSGRMMDLVDIISQIFDLIPHNVTLHADDDHWYYFQRSCWQISMILRSGSCSTARIQRLIEGQVLVKLINIMQKKQDEMPAASLCEAGQALAYSLLQATSLQMSHLIFHGIIKVLLRILASTRCSIRCTLAIVDGIAAILAMGVKSRALSMKKKQLAQQLLQQRLATTRSTNATAAAASATAALATASALKQAVHDSDDEDLHGTARDSDDDDDDTSKLNGYYEEEEFDNDSHNHCSSMYDLSDDLRMHQNKSMRRKRIKKQCTDSYRSANNESASPASSPTSSQLSIELDAPQLAGASRASTPHTSVSGSTNTSGSSSLGNSGILPSPTHSMKSKRKVGDVVDQQGLNRATTPTTPSMQKSLSFSNASIGANPTDEAAAASSLAGPSTQTPEGVLLSMMLSPTSTTPAASSASFTRDAVRAPLLANAAAEAAKEPKKARRKIKIVPRATTASPTTTDEVSAPAPFIPAVAIAGADATPTAAAAAGAVAPIESPAVPASTPAVASSATSGSTPAAAVPVDVTSPAPLNNYWFSYPNYNSYAGLLLSLDAYTLLCSLRSALQPLARSGNKDEKLLRTALDNVVAFFSNPALRAPTVFEECFKPQRMIAFAEYTTPEPMPMCDMMSLWTSPTTGQKSELKGSLKFRRVPPPPPRVRLAILRAAREAREAAFKAMSLRRRQIRNQLAWASLEIAFKPIYLTKLHQAQSEAAAAKKPPVQTAQASANVSRTTPTRPLDGEGDEDLSSDDGEDNEVAATSAIASLDPEAAAAEAARLRELRKKKLKNKKERAKRKKAQEREEKEKMAFLKEEKEKLRESKEQLREGREKLAMLRSEKEQLMDERERLAVLHAAQEKVLAAESSLAEADAALVALMREEQQMRDALFALKDGVESIVNDDNSSQPNRAALAAALAEQLNSAAAALAGKQLAASTLHTFKEAARVMAEVAKQNELQQPKDASSSSSSSAATLSVLEPSVGSGTAEASTAPASSSSSVPVSASAISIAEAPRKRAAAPPVIARCRNYNGQCSSSIRCITGFEEYIEMLCTEGCRINYHNSLPSKERSCFAQVCAMPLAQDEVEGGYVHRSPDTQNILFGGLQMVNVNIQLTKVDSEVRCNIKPFDFNATVYANAFSKHPQLLPSVRKIVRNSPCFTPDCAGKIASVLLKSGRGNQMKILKTIVQYREVNLRREQSKLLESRKHIREAAEARAAAEEAERAAELQERLAARAAEREAREQEREKRLAQEREKEKEREMLALARKEKEQKEQYEKRQKEKAEKRERQRLDKEMAEQKAAAVAAATASSASSSLTSSSTPMSASAAAFVPLSMTRDSPSMMSTLSHRPKEFVPMSQMQKTSSMPPAAPTSVVTSFTVPVISNSPVPLGQPRTTAGSQSPVPASRLLPSTPAASAAAAISSSVLPPAAPRAFVPGQPALSFAKVLNPHASSSPAPTATPATAAAPASFSAVTGAATTAVGSATTSSTSAPTNWASLMGGGSSNAASTNAATANNSASNSAAAAAAALANSKLTRRQKKDRQKPSMAYYENPLSIIRPDMVLSGLVRCRSMVPSRYLYVQHYSSLEELQNQCSQFGFHVLTSCINPTALLIEFETVPVASECYEVLNGMYFARYADDPLMILLDGETEALRIILPSIVPYGGTAQLSKREKMKLKRQEAIAATKDERLRRRLEKQQYRSELELLNGSNGNVPLALSRDSESPFLDNSEDSPYLLSSLPLNDDEVFPALGDTSGAIQQRKLNGSTSSPQQEAASSVNTSLVSDDGTQAIHPFETHHFLSTPALMDDNDDALIPSSSPLASTLSGGSGGGRDRDESYLFSSNVAENVLDDAEDDDQAIANTSTTSTNNNNSLASSTSFTNNAFSGSHKNLSSLLSTEGEESSFPMGNTWSMFDRGTDSSSGLYFSRDAASDDLAQVSETLQQRPSTTWSWNQSSNGGDEASVSRVDEGAPASVTSLLHASDSQWPTNPASVSTLGTTSNLSWLTTSDSANRVTSSTLAPSSSPFTSLLSNDASTLESSASLDSPHAADDFDILDDDADVGADFDDDFAAAPAVVTGSGALASLNSSTIPNMPTTSSSSYITNWSIDETFNGSSLGLGSMGNAFSSHSLIQSFLNRSIGASPPLPLSFDGNATIGSTQPTSSTSFATLTDATIPSSSPVASLLGSSSPFDSASASASPLSSSAASGGSSATSSSAAIGGNTTNNVNINVINIALNVNITNVHVTNLTANVTNKSSNSEDAGAHDDPWNRSEPRKEVPATVTASVVSTAPPVTSVWSASSSFSQQQQQQHTPSASPASIATTVAPVAASPPTSVAAAAVPSSASLNPNSSWGKGKVSAAGMLASSSASAKSAETEDSWEVVGKIKSRKPTRS